LAACIAISSHIVNKFFSLLVFLKQAVQVST
jgi:hypothetical protein